MIFYFYPNVYEKKSTAYIYNLIPLIPNTIWQQQVYASQYFLNILFDRFSTGWKQFNMFVYTSCAKSCSSQNYGGRSLLPEKRFGHQYLQFCQW